jgi:hypothetical protein
VFGSSLRISTPEPVQPRLEVILEDNFTTLFWNGAGFTLQKSSDLSSPDNWADVPGSVTRSPYTATVNANQSIFYRLRQ